jgi:Spy/CpxP family protein refolding chaperone
MKKRYAIIAAIVAVAVLAAVPFVHAGPGRGPGGHGFGLHGMHGAPGFGAGMLFEHLRHVKDELDLSDAQVGQIKTIFTDLHAQNEAYRDQVRGGFHAVAETLLKNPNDLAGAQALLDSQAAAEKAMKANMLAATSKALNVLTAEQRSELAGIVAEHQQRRAERRSRR